jgi:hypothetical protein
VLSDGVTAGEYTFELDGWMADDVLAGRFTTRKRDQIRTGYFVGGVNPRVSLNRLPCRPVREACP